MGRLQSFFIILAIFIFGVFIVPSLESFLQKNRADTETAYRNHAGECLADAGKILDSLWDEQCEMKGFYKKDGCSHEIYADMDTSSPDLADNLLRADSECSCQLSKYDVLMSGIIDEFGNAINACIQKYPPKKEQ